MSVVDLSLLEVVEQDAAKNHPGVDPKKIERAFFNALKTPGVLLFRHGNSVMIVRPDGDFHFINADRASQFAKNVKACFDQCKEKGFKKIWTNFTNPKVLEVAKMQPYPYTVVEELLNGKMQYILTLEL